MSDKRRLHIKIDVTKIDKAALFRGKKGIYLDAVAFVSEEPGQFGDNGMVTQDLGRERREAGEKGAILGNVRWGDSAPAKPPTTVYVDEDGNEEDEIPF